MPGAAPRHRRLLALALALLALNLVAAAGFVALGAGAGVTAASLGLLAWLLGVRHAFDADHIAAIDNVTRRLRAQGHRPVGVGLFFSLGHSSVVFVLTLALVLGLQRAGARGEALAAWGTPLSLFASAAFLTAIGLLNLRLLRALRRREAAPRRPLFDRVAGSGGMFPLGLLFGLNLDTAAEVLLLAASAAALPGALPPAAMLAFPLLFMAGMAVADSCEGLLMVRLYDWAVADADRSLRLNTATTVLSVVLALGVAALQWLALAQWSLGAPAGSPAMESVALGLGATGLMAALWLAARSWRLRPARV